MKHKPPLNQRSDSKRRAEHTATSPHRQHGNKPAQRQWAKDSKDSDLPRNPRWNRDDAPPSRDRYGKDDNPKRFGQQRTHRNDDRPPPRNPRWNRDGAPPQRDRYGKDDNPKRFGQQRTHRNDDRPPPRNPRWNRDGAPPSRDRYGKDDNPRRFGQQRTHRDDERPPPRNPRWNKDGAPPSRDRYGKDDNPKRFGQQRTHRNDDRPPPRNPRWNRDGAPPQRDRYGKDDNPKRFGQQRTHRNDDRPPPRNPRWNRDGAPPSRDRYGKDDNPRRFGQQRTHRNDDRPPPRNPRWNKDGAPPSRDRYGKDDNPRRFGQQRTHRDDDRPPPRNPRWNREDAPPQRDQYRKDDNPEHGRTQNAEPPRYQYSKTGKPWQKIERWHNEHNTTHPTRHSNSPTNHSRDSSARQFSSPPIADSEKVQKILADSGLGSRRQMEVYMEEGRVQVNGKIVAIGARATTADHIKVDGAAIPQVAKKHRLLLYYKPVGKVVSQSEEDGDSVFNDLPPANGGRWINLGRLDINSEGLLLFSTDGAWVQTMTHPKHGIEREYRVRASGTLQPETLATACRDGIAIDGARLLHPRQFILEREGEGLNCWYRIVLSEGRNRAVRRIFEHYNLQVSRLLRIRFGTYALPKDITPGEWKELSAPE